MFIHQIPSLVPRLFPKLIWEGNHCQDEPNVYFTFDDGPCPEITNFVLDELNKYQAKASFFCIGKNLVEFPGITQQILDNGHRIGNHTMNHANAWKMDPIAYLKEVEACEDVMVKMGIKSIGFRPPYGRLRPSFYYGKSPILHTYMWSILTGDYNSSLDPKQVIVSCKNAIKPGAILVFHDSLKAFPLLKIVLPALLKYCVHQGLKPISL
jgi:peptidoglycan/xylan/chitin deacetylase (PgdA/CDA1 family)